jgi:hypothetical protein
MKHEWDIVAATGIYKKIALHSLAYWLGGEYERCNGAKISASSGRACTHCAETPGREPVKGNALDARYIKDMITLEDRCGSHGARAGAKMRLAASIPTANDGEEPVGAHAKTSHAIPYMNYLY